MLRNATEPMRTTQAITSITTSAVRRTISKRFFSRTPVFRAPTSKTTRTTRGIRTETEYPITSNSGRVRTLSNEQAIETATATRSRITLRERTGPIRIIAEITEIPTKTWCPITSRTAKGVTRRTDWIILIRIRTTPPITSSACLRTPIPTTKTTSLTQTAAESATT